MCDPATAAIVIGTAATGKYMADKQASKQEDAMKEQRRLAEQQAAEQRRIYEAEQAQMQRQFEEQKAADQARFDQQQADALELEKKRELELAKLEAVPIMMRNDAQKTRTKGGSMLGNMKVKKKAEGYTSVGGVGGGTGVNV